MGALREALDHLDECAEGCSNDAEIQAGRDVADMTEGFLSAASEALDLYKKSMVEEESDDDAFIEFAIKTFEEMTGRDIGKEIVKDNQ